MTMSERYYTIINLITTSYEFNNNKEKIELFKDREYRYLLLLLVKKYNCYNEEEIKNILNVKTKRSVLNNVKKAEERLLINREFREKYFEMEERLLKYY